jgi:[acyl-carrier-protein] S-malonyltransferase
VRWKQTIVALTAGGISRVVECGPGGVLAGLVKRITRRTDTQVFALESPEDFTAALAATA